MPETNIRAVLCGPDFGHPAVPRRSSIVGCEGSRLPSVEIQRRIEFRAYRAVDRERVIRLLSVVPRLYPGGLKWLLNRVEEAAIGKGRFSLAVVGDRPVAALIDREKGRRATKLSTIYVHPEFRGLRLGEQLIRRAIRHWAAMGVDHYYVTAPARGSQPVRALLLGNGFSYLGAEMQRYGELRDELVFGTDPVANYAENCPALSPRLACC